MRSLPWLSASIAPLWVSPYAFAGLDSQALSTVELLPAVITQVLACGSWAERGQRGHYRIVLAEVSGGAGTEVYVQRILEPSEGSNQVARVLSTKPVRELNNDHSQYQVSAAKCVGKGSVVLRATYEHDAGNVERRITLVLAAAGKYRISNVIIPATNRP